MLRKSITNLGRLAEQLCPLVRRSCCGSAEPSRPPLKEFRKVLIADRSEIAIRIARACNEMGIKAIGIYSNQDRFSAHKCYMDQSFLVGKGYSPIEAYLNIPEIICIAKNNNADAIHPGHGFLSEREDFAQAVRDSGLEFIGPRPEVLRTLRDKTLAREAALRAGVPIIPGSTVSIMDAQKVKEFCKEFGFPIILKPAYGTGGRGILLVLSEDEIEEKFKRARSEALAAFGKSDILVEKYIEPARHIEVQILGDNRGNAVHLYERDCSIQRRYQSVIQIAPAQDMCPCLRNEMADMSVLFTKSIGYSNAGTVEFLVDKLNEFYFNELTPRLQLEYTPTEEITGVDIVQAQIKIAQGMTLSQLGLVQENIHTEGSAIQCLVRTEDPMRNFQPSSGRLDYFKAPASIGIRLDSSSPYPGQYILSDYDSLLAKIITHSSRYQTSCEKMRRALRESRASGVTTNLPFLLNIFENDKFLSGTALETTYIKNNPELLVRQQFEHRCRGEKILQFLAHKLVNGPKSPKTAISEEKGISPDPEIQFEIKTCDKITEYWFYKLIADSNTKYLLRTTKPKGFRNIIKYCGSDLFVEHVRKSKPLLLMDTTFRDAQQSLLATRVRTYDLKKASSFVSQRFHNLYAIELWSGAVFHSSLKFLHECPWERLFELRELIPNIPFQMLLRGSSLVGYQNYDSDAVETFCRLAVMCGIDIFRVYDSRNNVSNIMKGIHALDKKGGGSVLIEATICYAGDLNDPMNKKYTLGYYEDLADQLVRFGVKALCIKDTTGLLKPLSAKILINMLREKYPKILIHVHTHDTAGTAVASMLACVEAGADVIDVCADSMSGITSQPAMGTIIACLANTSHACEFDLNDVSEYSAYWSKVRSLYNPFIFSDLKSSTSDTYLHQIPGGQYSNFYFQAKSSGLEFEKVKKAYMDAKVILGDTRINRMTPYSKIVGDLALFMAQHNLSGRDIQENADELRLPRSAVEFFQGSQGEPFEGIPKDIQEKVLAHVEANYDGMKVSSLDDDKICDDVILSVNREENATTLSNLVMFPQETRSYLKFRETYGRVDKLPTRIFLNGPQVGEEFAIEFGQGDVDFIKLLGISTSLNEYGERAIFFTYNGRNRSVLVRDHTVDNQT